MSVNAFRILRAIPTLMVGMALFLSACQKPPRIMVGPPPVEETAESLFLRADAAFQAGRESEALRGYTLYLEKHPEGKDAATALFRIAWFRYSKGRLEEALDLFQRMIRDYPDHPQLPKAHQLTAAIRYRLGDYAQAKMTALEWAEEYPDHPLKGEIFTLLGDIELALEDAPKSLFWWIKAIDVLKDREKEAEAVSERIIALIQSGSPDDLQAMADTATRTPFAPYIYHRLASSYLDAGELENAREAAMTLIRSTPEQQWVSLGRQILEKIEEALSARPGVIGCLLPLSGPFAIYGQEILNGIQLGMGLFDESDEGAGIELIIKDTGGDEERALLQVEDLAQRGKVMAIIGPLTSKTSQLAARKAQAQGVPIITFTQVDGITSAGDMVFRNFLTPSREVDRILEKAFYDLEISRFGILYPDNTYGRFLMNLFWDRVDEMGGAIMAVETYDPRETDFAVQIKKMVGLHYPRPESVKQMLREMKALTEEEGNPQEEKGKEKEEEPEPIVDFDAVFIPDSFQHVALITPQFPFYNVFNVRFLGTSLWQSPELITLAGDYVQGAVFPAGFFSGDESDQISDFITLYRENFDAEPGILSATGYDTIRLIKHIMKSGTVRTRLDFRERLLSGEGIQGVTGLIAFDARGEVIKDPALVTVSGRSFTLAR